MNTKIKTKFIFYFCLIFAASLCGDSRVEFAKSFLTYYELNGAGRYAHEYHPFLLKKTAKSLDELEDGLVDKGFDVSGRIVIAGYEEQAVPSFYTNIKDFKGYKINDEASIKNNTGWSMRLHNRFGLMTGFLFRHCNYIEDMVSKDKEALFEHINSRKVDIFDDDAILYQQHAFGDVFTAMLKEQEQIECLVAKKDTTVLFDRLINFWKTLYDFEVKNGDRHVAGTQDILFSIEHARHVKRSPLPLFKYFVGPDITYPIKISKNQKKAATFHAQTFTKRFLDVCLKQRDEKPTAYIFNSFVDGVGKSTMLGNIMNSLRSGQDYESFKHVDNSSSQLAEIYDCGNDVYIADLPAQISHFTYKPDGLVYANIEWQLKESEVGPIEKFVIRNKEKLCRKHEELFESVRNIIKRKGVKSAELNCKSDPEKSFIKNLFLLKKDKSNKWITFKYKNKRYIFDYTLPSNIRVLVSLEKADSMGLKNALAEQMLFFDGIVFPCNYDAFIKDLVGKLRKNGVEKIVFVDFLSMYPRSSRENIRINYLIQQQALLDDAFDVSMSPYAEFVSDSHLFYVLKNDRELKILDALEQETLVRLALYEIMEQCQDEKLTILSVDKLTYLIKDIMKSFSQDLRKKISKSALMKIKQEHKNLERIHGRTKEFVNIQEFKPQDIVLFSAELQKVFSEYVDNFRMRALWRDSGNIAESVSGLHDGWINKPVRMQNGDRETLLFIFNQECKDEQILGSVFRMVRASWYASLLNLMESERIGDYFQNVHEKYRVPPIKVTVGNDGRICVLQKRLDPWYKDIPRKETNCDFFHLTKKAAAQWGEFAGEPYCILFENKGTHNGLYSYGCDSMMSDYSLRYRYYNAPDISYLLREYQKKEDVDIVWPTSDAHEKWSKKLSQWYTIEEYSYWEKVTERLKKRGSLEKQEEEKKTEKKDSEKVDKDEKEKDGKEKDEKSDEKKEEQKKDDEEKEIKEKQDSADEKQDKDQKNKFKLCNPKYAESMRFVIRAIATLDMIMKDAKSDIVVRRGNRADFIAAIKLFEKMTMPIYFGIVMPQDLFKDYYYAETIIPFYEWDRLA